MEEKPEKYDQTWVLYFKENNDKTSVYIVIVHYGTEKTVANRNFD